MDEETGGRDERELADALNEVDRLRDSGQELKAQRACQQLLVQHPTSALLHEKMGDILYHRELWQDAAEWYELSSQLSETPEIVSKTENAKSRAREARLGGLEPEGTSRPTLARRRVLLLLLGVAAIITVVVMVFVVTRLLRGPQAQTLATEEEGVVTGEAPRGFSLTGPHVARGVTRPSPRAPGAPAQQAHENPQRHWSAEEPPPRPRRTSSGGGTTVVEGLMEPITDVDRAVISAVSSLNWGEGREMVGRVAAMVDPYTGYAFISVSIPADLPEGDLLEQVVRQAHRICLAAIRANENIRYITIRMLRTVGKQRVTAFRGNTSRPALEKYRSSDVSFDALWNRVFKSVWWNPQVGGSMPVESGATP